MYFTGQIITPRFCKCLSQPQNPEFRRNSENCQLLDIFSYSGPSVISSSCRKQNAGYSR